MPTTVAAGCLVAYSLLNLCMMVGMSLCRVSDLRPKDGAVNFPTKLHKAQTLTAEYSGVLCGLFAAVHCSLAGRASFALQVSMVALVVSRVVFVFFLVTAKDHRLFNFGKFSGALGTYVFLAATIALSAIEL